MGRTIRFVTHSPPAPGISGDRMRVYHLMRELKERGWSIRAWSLVGKHEPDGFGAALEAVADEVVLVPNQLSQARRIARLGRDTVARQAFQARWFWSPATARAAARWLADDASDPIVVEQLYMYPFVPPSMRRRIALDTQNHETARMRAIANGDGGIARRSAARLQIGPVERFEADVMRNVGLVMAVSEAEAAAFEPLAPGRVRLIPNGVDVVSIVPLSRPTASRDLVFLGSLGYGANRDAVRHFSEDIAPFLVGTGATMTVVGGGADSTVRHAAERGAIPIAVAGFIPDLAPVYRGSRVMVVPLRHGGGTRLKILEGLAWGLPVVTTTLGASGLGLVDGRQALIADDPAAFARAVQRLLKDDELWMTLSVEGRAFVEERFGWHQIGDSVDVAMRDLADEISRHS
jgi:glycosyltransferase involved in cell wall biosynthesis